jgi:hypothetical protein
MEAALACFMPGAFDVALPGEEKFQNTCFPGEAQPLGESRIRREFTTFRGKKRQKAKVS